ncbi:3-hydroxyacyl-CoA dehydrogenase/enoyl-CoA hydratase family protein [Ampullimonas aquatilis]|uniref:3-hydroxyacyl-CoA dehydrogenase/enoyl-CoA hydratase family protein n=1 Tax=Ampullimonas aquatilis TaxID=1341549 RepID=UPI003C75ABD9
MSNFIVKKVAVLGAGVMGAQIAGHLVNARVPVMLFDLPAKEGNKNGVVIRAIENLKKLNPAPLAIVEDAQFLEPVNYEDDLDKLSQCDLIIEAIAERLDWKHDLYKKVAPHIRTDAIFATNTSGLSITALSEGFDADLKARFLGVHFFNPPRYMHLVELIPTAATRSDILDALETFLTTVLGKGVVRALDTPNFIANRVGMFSILSTMIEAERYGLTYEVVDDITGAKLGRARSGTFRTADVVGLDTMIHVGKTMENYLKDDPFAPIYPTPAVMKKLVEQGDLGQKSGAGFFKKVGKDILRLDPASFTYVAADAKTDELVARILKKEPKERFKLLRESSHPQAQFVWAIFRNTFHYVALHLNEIADSAREIDFAIRWGFGWGEGPFEIWQAAGWQEIAKWVKEDIDAGKALCAAPLPEWVFTGAVANNGGVHAADGSYSASKNAFVSRSDLPIYNRQYFRAPVLGEGALTADKAGKTVKENDSVRLWTLDGEILIYTPKTKANTINHESTATIFEAIREAEANFKGLVIWSPSSYQGKPFCGGADLQSMLPLFMSGGAKAIEQEVSHLQQSFMALRYANVPTVAAVGGMAVGGGCEMLVACQKRVALLESYIGLVEVGVGLLPGAGGLTHAARRAAEESKGGVILPFLTPYFQSAATAAVSKSALDAQNMGYLLTSDIVVFNMYELLSVALKTAKAMADTGSRPPLRRPFRAAGRNAKATIATQILNLSAGGFISEHDRYIANKIAHVVCGGDVEENSLINEQWVLDLEREAFCELIEHPKTQERIMGILQNGKPVRN